MWTSRIFIFNTPMSTAVEAIGFGDVCLVDSIEKDTSPSTMFANVSESSLLLGWLEKCSCVITRAVRVCGFGNKLNGDIVHS